MRKKHEYRKRVVLEHDSVNLRPVDNEILGRTGRQEMTRALWVRRKYTEHTYIQRGEDGMTSQWKDSSSFRSLHFFCVLNYSVNGVLSTVCLTGWQEVQQEGDIKLCSKKKIKKKRTPSDEREIKISAEQTGHRKHNLQESRISPNGECCIKHINRAWGVTDSVHG